MRRAGAPVRSAAGAARCAVACRDHSASGVPVAAPLGSRSYRPVGRTTGGGAVTGDRWAGAWCRGRRPPPQVVGQAAVVDHAGAAHADPHRDRLRRQVGRQDHRLDRGDAAVACVGEQDPGGLGGVALSLVRPHDVPPDLGDVAVPRRRLQDDVTDERAVRTPPDGEPPRRLHAGDGVGQRVHQPPPRRPQVRAGTPEDDVGIAPQRVEVLQVVQRQWPHLQTGRVQAHPFSRPVTSRSTRRRAVPRCAGAPAGRASAW